MSVPERKNPARTGGRAMHDVGGSALGPIDRSEHDLALWEKRTDAMLMLIGITSGASSPLTPTGA